MRHMVPPESNLLDPNQATLKKVTKHRAMGHRERNVHKEA